MKIGDKVYCHTDCIFEETKEQSLSKYKRYEIIQVKNNSFVILDDLKSRHEFSFDVYEKWLISLKKLRKQKLKKINESER